MPELTSRVMHLARQSLSKGAALQVCGGMLGLICKLFMRQLDDPEHQWIAGPTNLFLLVFLLAALSLIIQSRILFHAAFTGLTGATFQRVMSRTPAATEATRKEWWMEAGKLIGEMLLGAGAAWGIFKLAIDNDRLPPGASRAVVEVVLGFALFMAALGTCLGVWMAYIGAIRAPPMANTEPRRNHSANRIPARQTHYKERPDARARPGVDSQRINRWPRGWRAVQGARARTRGADRNGY